MNMKSLWVVLSSLLATAALAQPFISPPEMTAVLERSPFSTRVAPAMSLAPDGDGFVAAWSAGAAPSRIYAARLNAAFKPVSPILKLESYLGEAFDANYPDIAPIDGGYAIVWLERERISMPRPASVILARLTPAFALQPAMEVTGVADNGLARIVDGNADHVSVLVQGNVFTLNANGSRELTQISSANVEDASVPRGAPVAVATRQFNPPTYIPWCGGTPACTFGSWSLRVQFDKSTFSTNFDKEFAGPAIGYGNGIYLVAWLDNVTKPAGFVGAVRLRANGTAVDPFIRPMTLGNYAGNEWSTRPSIAWDGERFLVVWQSGHEIVGAASMPGGGFDNFTLVTTPADAQRPLVVAVRPGRFALAYEVPVDAEHRQLAWRSIDFNAPPLPPRRRATR